jgi:hypothetical protein
VCGQERRDLIAHIASFSLQKGGNYPNENDDACRPTGKRGVRSDRFRAAVSDGATEGFQSGRWANYLVEAFVRSASLDVQRVSRHARRRWKQWLTAYLDERARAKPIQWWEEPGLEQGAFASIIGLQIEASANGDGSHWDAIAIGDSCLFHVRGTELLRAFPISDSTAFTNRPILVPSNIANIQPQTDKANYATGGECRPDDTFYLATDAFAQWILARSEEHRSPWLALRDLDTDAEIRQFDDWIRELRASGELRNDDVTLVRLDLL